MNGRDGMAVPGDAIALLCVVVWTCAAFATHTFGLWMAFGITGAVLAAAVLVFARPALWGAGAHGRGWAIGIAAGVTMAIATEWLTPAVLALTPRLADDVAQLFAELHRPGPPVAWVLMPPIVVCEEIVWRGAVQAAVTRRMGWRPAVSVVPCVYALAHLPTGSLALVLTCLAAGACWGVVRAMTDSLPATIATHLAWDLLVLLIEPPLR